MIPFVLLILLTSELPDPGAPMFPGLCAGYGGFAAGLVAWRRRRPLGPHVAAGTLMGFGLGFVGWIATLATDRL